MSQRVSGIGRWRPWWGHGAHGGSCSTRSLWWTNRIPKGLHSYNMLQHVGSTGGFARNFNMWGGLGCVNVGVHVYTWYSAGVFMCTHGTLLVCHVQTYHAIAVSCSIVHRSATRCTKSNSTKQHSWQIVPNGNAVNYRWLLIFPPDLAEKNQVWT